MTTVVRPFPAKPQFAWDCFRCKVGAAPYDFEEAAARAAKEHDDLFHPSATEGGGP